MSSHIHDWQPLEPGIMDGDREGWVACQNCQVMAHKPPEAPIHPELFVCQDGWAHHFMDSPSGQTCSKCYGFLDTLVKAWSDHRSNEARLDEWGGINVYRADDCTGIKTDRGGIYRQTITGKARIEQLKAITPSNPKESK